jgi:hypothetical protein
MYGSRCWQTSRQAGRQAGRQAAPHDGQSRPPLLACDVQREVPLILCNCSRYHTLNHGLSTHLPPHIAVPMLVHCLRLASAAAVGGGQRRAVSCLQQTPIARLSKEQCKKHRHAAPACLRLASFASVCAHHGMASTPPMSHCEARSLPSAVMLRKQHHLRCTQQCALAYLGLACRTNVAGTRWLPCLWPSACTKHTFFIYTRMHRYCLSCIQEPLHSLALPRPIAWCKLTPRPSRTCICPG